MSQTLYGDVKGKKGEDGPGAQRRDTQETGKGERD